MANSDKNILITPSVGLSTSPTIKFNGANNTPTTLRVLDDGTVSFEGTAGQLFSISDGLIGSIFSVNDISGIPSLEILDTGLVKLNEYGGSTVFGSATAIQNSSLVNSKVSISTVSASAPGLIIKGAASQTASLVEWHNSAGNVLSFVGTVGQFGTSATVRGSSGGIFGGNTQLSSAGLTVYAPAAATIGAIIRGAASQTSNLQEWQDSAGGVLAYVSNNGTFQNTGDINSGFTIRLGGATSAGGYPVFAIKNVTVAPTSNPTNGGVIYVESGSLKYRGSGGINAQFEAYSATDKPIVIKGFASQTADLQQWQDSAGTVLAKVDANGSGTFTGSASTNAVSAYSGAAGNYVFQGFNQSNSLSSIIYQSGEIYSASNIYIQGAANYSAAINVRPGSTSTIGQVIRANASQTANLQEWQNSAGTVLANVNASGNATFNTLTVNTNNTVYFGTSSGIYGTTVAIKTYTDANVGLVVQATGSGQTGNLQNWNNSVGTVLTSVDKDGYLQTPRLTITNGGNIVDSAGTTPYFGFGSNQIRINTRNAAYKGLVIQGEVSQTANLQEWQNSSGTVITRVGPSGVIETTVQLSARSALTAGTDNYLSASLSVIPLNASVVGQVIRGVASQTANLQEWQNSTGFVFAKIDAYGNFTFNTAANVINGALAAYTPLTVKGAASQSANLQEWQNSAGTVLAKINSAGELTTPNIALAALGGIYGAGGPYITLNYTDTRIITAGLSVSSASVTPSAQLQVTNGVAGTIAMIVKGAASQTADLQQWQDSTGTINARVTLSSGLLVNSIANIGGGSAPYLSLGTTAFALYPNTATNVGLKIIGAASQTANLQEWQNSAGTVLAKVSSAGKLVVAADGEIASATILTSTAVAGGVNVTASSTANDYSLALSASGGSTGSTVGIAFQVWGGTGFNGVYQPGAGIWFTRTGGYSAGYLAFATRESASPVTTVVERMRIGETGTITIAGFTASSVGTIIKGAASQSANLQEWQDSSGIVLSNITNFGGARLYDLGIKGAPNGIGWAYFGNDNTSTKNVVVRGFASQTANLTEWQDSTGAVIAKLDPAGGFTAGTPATTNIKLDATAAGAKIHFGIPATVNNYATLGAYSSVFNIEANARSILTTVTNSTTTTTLIVKANTSQTANLQEWQNSAGTVLSSITSSGLINTTIGLNANAIYVGNGYLGANIQAAFSASTASYVPIVIRGAASQTANLQEWQNSAGSVLAKVDKDGNNYSNAFVTPGFEFYSAPENSGGFVYLKKETAAAANPGSGAAKIYFRDGTTAGTLKLVVRAGTAGAETTILDNIPQS